MKLQIMASFLSWPKRLHIVFKMLVMSRNASLTFMYATRQKARTEPSRAMVFAVSGCMIHLSLL